MVALANRVKALEGIVGMQNPNSGRIYCVTGHGTLEEVADFIAADGWQYDARADLIIRLVPLGGSNVVVPGPKELHFWQAPDLEWRIAG